MLSIVCILCYVRGNKDRREINEKNMYGNVYLKYLVVCNVFCSNGASGETSGSAGTEGNVEEPGKKAGRGDIAILRMNLSKLKHSYNANVEGFDLQKGNIDTKVLFEHSVFGDKFKLDNQDNERNDFYASLKHDIVDIKVVERLIKELANSSDNMVQSDALLLLATLSMSGRCVSEVISLLETELITLYQSNDVAGISEINVILMMMLRQRESVIDDVKEILTKAKLHLSSNPINITGIRVALSPITRLGGKVREKISGKILGTNRDLQSLRGIIEDKINKLRQALVP
ncbi:hypothetical protein [Borrelia hermsii]|uniref:Uncharacterized protein n=2 Tax=Borrelia hermsii TaxID=140 RepID=T1EC94_BORHE|nr:hypothetical protein [Borrelia hermsii]ADN26306.1 hypothetical protein BHA053 [Borrelia hermsii]AMR75889.1 hypothetical protein A0V01_04565 [Borrelia hermsii]ANA43695.1 hypothetical protein AXX13_A0255 [Borrelia hermsii HS1]UCP01921.1 hypothetical protein K9R62_04610 [Borrelia hermsii]UPA08488.1 hypothetical protein bhDAH_001196 [Borrelia hermsii DAH]